MFGGIGNIYISSPFLPAHLMLVSVYDDCSFVVKSSVDSDQVYNIHKVDRSRGTGQYPDISQT